ncbi:ABSCISIC ACID-INSENSITIVE 5-like protein 1, partial [Linum grandiflorum]
VLKMSTDSGNQIKPQNSDPPSQPEVINDANSSNSNSFWSLTLRELELKHGKSFGSMNMEEFLADLWNVDSNDVDNDIDQLVLPQPTDHKQALLVQQPPVFPIPSPLCNKTVDDVLFEIQREQNPTNIINDDNNVAVGFDPSLQRQHSDLGEMTLEDFLVLAGVVKKPKPPMTPELQPSTSSQELVSKPTSFQVNSSDKLGGFVPYQTMSTPINNVNEVYGGGEPSNAGEQPKEKIVTGDGSRSVAMERRHRRMIKNRESASRSRARKQAYTLELEIELNFLKEENTKLKQSVEIEDKKRVKRTMMMKKEGLGDKKKDKLKSIRRTTSMGW